MIRTLEGAENPPVVFVADRLREVLKKRAAERDIDELHAAADTEHRHVALDRAARERKLERVALGNDVDRFGVRLASVRRRVDIGASREHQAIDQLQRLRRVTSGLLVGRQQQRKAAGALHGFEVVGAEQRGTLLPHAPARGLERGADADHRAVHAYTIGSPAAAPNGAGLRPRRRHDG